MSYIEETFKGVSWVGFLRISIRIFGFVRIALLARLLSPNQFGEFGIVAFVLGLLEILTETGIAVLYIQIKNFNNFLNTAWTLSIIRGFFIGLLIVISTLFAELIFDSTEIPNLLFAISIVPIVRGFISPAIVKFQKDLNFNKEFILRLAIYVSDTLVVVTVAFLSQSTLSFVYGLIAGSISEVLLSFLLVKERPQFTLDKKIIKKIFDRGKWINVYGLFNYLFENIDDIILGKMLGTSFMGVYQAAYKISTIPISEVAEVFVKVNFPFYRKISVDIKKLRRSFKLNTLAISILTVPIGLVFLFFPTQIVLVILGENWLSAVPVLRILAIYGVFKAIINSGYTIFLAINKQEYVTYITGAGLFGILLTIVPLIKYYGVLGAAYSVLLGYFLTTPLYIYYIHKVLFTKQTK